MGRLSPCQRVRGKGGSRRRLHMLIQRFLGTKKRARSTAGGCLSLLGFWTGLERTVPFCPELPGSRSPRLKQAGEIFRKSRHSDLPPQQFPKEGAAPQQQPCRERADSAIWGPAPLPHLTRLLAQACWAAVSHGASGRVVWPSLSLGVGWQTEGHRLPGDPSQPGQLPHPYPHRTPSLLF